MIPLLLDGSYENVSDAHVTRFTIQSHGQL